MTFWVPQPTGAAAQTPTAGWKSTWGWETDMIVWPLWPCFTAHAHRCDWRWKNSMRVSVFRDILLVHSCCWRSRGSSVTASGHPGPHHRWRVQQRTSTWMKERISLLGAQQAAGGGEPAQKDGLSWRRDGRIKAHLESQHGRSWTGEEQKTRQRVGGWREHTLQLQVNWLLSSFHSTDLS